MLLKILLLIVLPFTLMSKEFLKKDYFTDTNNIKLSTITSNPKDDVILFKIKNNKHFMRIKSKKIIKLLKQHGYNSFSFHGSYVKFTKKSPINLTTIKNKIKDLYTKKYMNIKIKKIFVNPRSYIETLPKNYQIKMQSKSHLYNHGIFYIKTPQKKEIFFNYHIDAIIPIYIARKNIKKGVEISLINSIKKNIVLDKFRALPIQNITKGTIQTKHHIKKNTIITQRDIVALDMVKRDSNINVDLASKAISITFIAKALQDGKLNDIITIQKSDGKRLKAKVIGKNRVEVQ